MNNRRSPTPWVLVRTVVSVAFLLTGLVSALTLWRDGHDLHAAVQCEPPVRADRACVFEITGQITGRVPSEAPGSQDVTVALDNGEHRRASVYRIGHELQAGDRVAAKIWDGNVVALSWQDQQGITDWNWWLILLVIFVGWPGLAMTTYFILSMTVGAASGPTAYAFITGAVISIIPIALGNWLWVLALAIGAVTATAILEPRAARKKA